MIADGEHLYSQHSARQRQFRQNEAGNTVMRQPQDVRDLYPIPNLRHIRLLIVDDMPDTAQSVQKLLHFEHDIQVVGVAMSGREALEKVAALRPDVVLMDINLRDMDGLKVTEMITRQMLTCVVMMSVQGEPEYMTRAMMVGARGYLVKPFTSDELVNTVRTASAAVAAAVRMTGGPQRETAGPTPQEYNQAPQALKRMIAVYSPKGGVGCSVLAAILLFIGAFGSFYYVTYRRQKRQEAFNG